jgi:hypothetical protein
MDHEMGIEMGRFYSKRLWYNLKCTIPALSSVVTATGSELKGKGSTPGKGK